MMGNRHMRLKSLWSDMSSQLPCLSVGVRVRLVDGEPSLPNLQMLALSERTLKPSKVMNAGSNDVFSCFGARIVVSKEPWRHKRHHMLRQSRVLPGTQHPKEIQKGEGFMLQNLWLAVCHGALDVERDVLGYPYFWQVPYNHILI